MWCCCYRREGLSQCREISKATMWYKAFFICGIIMSSLGHANVASEERLFHTGALFWRSPSLIIHDCWFLQLCAPFLRAVGWKEIPWRSERQEKIQCTQNDSVWNIYAFSIGWLKSHAAQLWYLSCARLKLVTVTWMYVSSESPELGWWAGWFPYSIKISVWSRLKNNFKSHCYFT